MGAHRPGRSGLGVSVGWLVVGGAHGVWLATCWRTLSLNPPMALEMGGLGVVVGVVEVFWAG